MRTKYNFIIFVFSFNFIHQPVNLKRRGKNIGLLMVWLLTAAFAMHVLIPHHHHYDSVYSHTPDKCCPLEETNDHPGDTAHCHAFNEIYVDNQEPHDFEAPDSPDFDNNVCLLEDPLILSTFQHYERFYRQDPLYTPDFHANGPPQRGPPFFA